MQTNTDRLPPHDQVLEAALLGCLLLGNRDAILDTLEAHHELAHYFYDARHQAIFAAVRDLADGNQPVDVVTVQSLLRKRDKLPDAGGLEYLTTLPDRAPTGGLSLYHADQLREFYIKRRALSACCEIEADVYSDKPASAITETLERELNGIAPDNAPREANIRQLVQSAIDDIEEAHRNQGRPAGITTGLADLDRITHGLRPGQFFVIGARPGVGKTALAANIAEHTTIDCNLPTGIIELEMTAKELTLRLMSARSGIPLDRLLSGNLVEGDIAAIASANGQIAKAPLYIADESGITISQLRAKARRMRRRHNLRLLIVDYLQLIRPSRPNASRNVEVSEISSSLKALAKELNLPVIALSQLNRDSDADNREPRLRDLRDSGSIEQDADIVGLLHRPDPEGRQVQLHIAKHRQGPTRKIALMFFGETFRFRLAEYAEHRKAA